MGLFSLNVISFTSRFMGRLFLGFFSMISIDSYRYKSPWRNDAKCDVIITWLKWPSIIIYFSSSTHKKLSLFYLTKLHIHIYFLVIYRPIWRERSMHLRHLPYQVFNGKIMFMFCKSYSLIFCIYIRLLINVKLAENFVVYN